MSTWSMTAWLVFRPTGLPRSPSAALP